MATLADMKSLFMEQETKSLSLTHPVTFSGSADESGFKGTIILFQHLFVMENSIQ